MINNVLFDAATALSAILQLGFEPVEDCFCELTNDQYEKLREEGEDISETWYVILADNNTLQVSDPFVVNEHEKDALLKAARIVEKYCQNSNVKFKSYQDKLKHVACLLPPVFTTDSYCKKDHLKLVESK